MTRFMIHEVNYAYPTYIYHFVKVSASALTATNDIGQYMQPGNRNTVNRSFCGDSRYCAS